MAIEEITFVYGSTTLDAEFALREIQNELVRINVPMSGFELYGKPVELPAACQSLSKTGRRTFKIVGNGYEFQLSSIRNFRMDTLTIRANCEDARSWDKWATRFVHNPNFVMAWLADSDYQFWQNAENLLQYASQGRPHAHLPKKSNNLPPPLEQTIVDVSFNPGRRVLRTGYYEVVGAVMWLGEVFWSLTKADKAGVEKASWLQVDNLSNVVIRVTAAEKCFSMDEGSSRETQRGLRALLFPE